MARALICIMLLLGACGGQPPTGLSDRELAWCLSNPGAVGPLAQDSGGQVPEAAQRVVDRGIYDDASRWAFHDGWDEGEYIRHCMAAYAQFDGVSDDVDMTILDAAAHEPTDPPTPNLDTGSLRERASELISAMEATGADMMAAVDAGDRAAMRAAADALRALTGPEIETLKDAEAEDCYAEAGSAYGWTLSNWDLAASNIRRYADAGEELALEVGLDFAADAMESTADWRRADDAAC